MSQYIKFEKFLRDAVGYLYRELRKEFPIDKSRSVIIKTVNKILDELEKETDHGKS